MVDKEICYYEKSRLEANMKIEKPHKTSFYKDKKDGFVYCGICEKDSFSGKVRYMARLIESKRHYISDPSRLEYSVSKAKPLRHNQTITDEELQEEFEEKEGKYIRIEDLKFLWEEKSGKWPDGFIKINDSDKSTTVISSSYLRRLGKITQLVWTQQRAEGEKGEKLVIFRRTKERWIDPKEKAKRERLEKLKLLNLEEKWENKLMEEESELSIAIEEGVNPELYDVYEENIDDMMGVGPDWYEFENDDEKTDYISEKIVRINKIRDALGRRPTSLEEEIADAKNNEF